MLVWHLAFYALLAALPTLTLVTDSSVETPRRAVGIGLTLLLGGWYAVGGARLGWRCVLPGVRPFSAVFLASSWMIWVGLTTVYEAYDIFLGGLLIQVLLFLPVWQSLAGGVLLAALAVGREFALDDGASGGWVLSLVIMFSMALLLHASIDALARQSERRQRLINTLATTRSQLASQERRAGTLEERERLAREIHDTLAQGFAGIVMQLEAADADLGPEQANARHHLGRARRIARDSLSEARRFVWALRPKALEEHSLAEVLSRLATQWSAETGVATELITTGEHRALHPTHEVTLLRVAQEALANVRQHAAAKRVVITLSYLPDRVILDIDDDGTGFHLDASSVRGDDGALAHGFGLASMRQRIEQLDGQLSIDSEPGRGTTLAIELPTRQAAVTLETVA